MPNEYYYKFFTLDELNDWTFGIVISRDIGAIIIYKRAFNIWEIVNVMEELTGRSR